MGPHLWHATAEVEEEEEEAHEMRLARQDGMASEGFVRDNKEIYVSAINKLDNYWRREEVKGL